VELCLEVDVIICIYKLGHVLGACCGLVHEQAGSVMCLVLFVGLCMSWLVVLIMFFCSGLVHELAGCVDHVCVGRYPV